MTPGRGDARKQNGGSRSRAPKPAARTGESARRAGKPVKRVGQPAKRGGQPGKRSDQQGKRAAPPKRTGKPPPRSGKPPARTGKPARAATNRTRSSQPRRTATRQEPVRGLRQSGALWRRPDTEPVARAGPPNPAPPRVKQRDTDGSAKRAPLRVVRGGKGAKASAPGKARQTRAPRKAPSRQTRAPRTPARRARGPSAAEVRDEIVQQGGARGTRFYERFVRAAEAYAADRERDAIRVLRPLRDALPNAVGVRELLGLSLYAAGQFGPAAEELEVYVARTGAVDRHPVLMDCYRSERKWARVDALWDELCATSAAPDVMTEGRIVVAGSLADRGRLRAATALLRRRATQMPRRVDDHHLRLWYALADLEERGGNLPRARDLFARIRERDPAFADVAERVAALA